MNEISVEEYEKLPQGVIATGFISDSPTGCNIDNSGLVLQYVVYKESPWWWIAVDRHSRDQNIELEDLAQNGLKVKDTENIKRIFNANRELLSLYND